MGQKVRPIYHVHSGLPQRVAILTIEKRPAFMNLLVAMSGQLPFLGL